MSKIERKTARTRLYRAVYGEPADFTINSNRKRVYLPLDKRLDNRKRPQNWSWEQARVSIIEFFNAAKFSDPNAKLAELNARAPKNGRPVEMGELSS